jgi:predicted component of type VI protein secretion system
VHIHARLTRWRCRNDQCDRRIFADRLPGLAAPFARRTARLDGIVRLFGHSAGGRPSERLMARLGMTYGTVIVDLERRQVVDLLADRSAATAADWFKGHPEIEVVSRDRAGLYADAARQGAPQARQIADRFHLLKNFRETIERQLGRFEARIRESPVQAEDDQDTPEQKAIERLDRCSDVAAHERLVRRGREATRQAMFDEIRHSLNLAVMSGISLGSWVSVAGVSSAGCVASTCRS